MGTAEEDRAVQWDEEEKEEEKEEKKKKKGMCAKLLKFFASLGGQICQSTKLLPLKLIRMFNKDISWWPYIQYSLLKYN